MTKTMVVCDVDGTLTDGSVYVDSNGNESLRFCKRDGWLLDEAKAAGIEVVMVTTDPSTVPARERANKLGLRFGNCSPRQYETDKQMTKADVVRGWKGNGHRVVYIGDSPADLEAMRLADEAWCPADADPLRRVGDRMPGATDFPDLDRAREHRLVRADAKGGHGVLYEVLDRLLARAE